MIHLDNDERIVNPIPPEELDPHTHAPLAGDFKDDDATVYEEDFQAADHTATDLKPIGLPHTTEELPPFNRLLTRGRTIKVNDPPFMLLPPDTERKYITIMVRSNAGSPTNSIAIASTLTDCYNAEYLVPLSSGNAIPFTIDRYTGALWVYANPAGVSDIYISVIAVTG